MVNHHVREKQDQTTRIDQLINAMYGPRWLLLVSGILHSFCLFGWCFTLCLRIFHLYLFIYVYGNDQNYS